MTFFLYLFIFLLILDNFFYILDFLLIKKSVEIWFFFVPSATEKLVQRARQLVDVRKDDGFAALHLAALNGHCQVTETLLTLGQADADLTNNKRQTPLLLAISQVGKQSNFESSLNHWFVALEKALREYFVLKMATHWFDCAVNTDLKVLDLRQADLHG